MCKKQFPFTRPYAILKLPLIMWKFVKQADQFKSLVDFLLNSSENSDRSDYMPTYAI